MAEKKVTKRRCFIAADATVDTSVIKGVLRQMGFQARDVSNLQSAGSATAWIANEIRKADAVVAVWGGSYGSANVAYEAGLAQGLGKPIIWIGSDFQFAPFPEPESAFIQASPANRQAVEFGLGEMLPRLVARTPAKKGIAERSRRPHVHGDLVMRLEALRDEGNGPNFEAAVRDLIEADPRVSAIAESKVDVPADFALWLEGFHSTIGNPVLVECKLGRLSETRLSEAELSLEWHLVASNAKFALLIYLDKNGRRFPRVAGFPMIVRVDAVDLANAMQKFSLGEILLRERNRVMHGKGS